MDFWNLGDFSFLFQEELWRCEFLEQLVYQSHVLFMPLPHFIGLSSAAKAGLAAVVVAIRNHCSGDGPWSRRVIAIYACLGPGI